MQNGSTVYNIMLIFCLFDLILYIPVNNFSVMLGRIFLGRSSTKQDFMCLAKGQNTVPPVRFEPATLPSRVKHSTTEQLSSLQHNVKRSPMLELNSSQICIALMPIFLQWKPNTYTCNFTKISLLKRNHATSGIKYLNVSKTYQTERA